MDSNHMLPAIRESERRVLGSWIDSFVKYTDNIGAPKIFRRWSAIGALAAVLEQRCWVETYDRLYPNLFLALIGHPGAGKSTSITQARKLLEKLDDFWIAPTQMTRASLIDALMAHKKYQPITHNPPRAVYNSMFCMADEWGALISDFQTDFISTMTTLYDVTVPYGEWKRTGELRIDIASPQLSILAGSTPSVLIKFMPEHAWDQGFTSRIILIYCDQKPAFQSHWTSKPNEQLEKQLISDLKHIYKLEGAFAVDDSYKRVVDEWRGSKHELPRPTHPKLVHYNTRRSAHIYKLSMVASVDRGSDLCLNDIDFHVALGWLQDAEQHMPEIFIAGTPSSDAHAMDDIADFVFRQGHPVRKDYILRHASNIIASHRVVALLDLMLASRRLVEAGMDAKTGQQLYTIGD